MFLWDAEKALGNYRKHRITFEEATTVFSDAQSLEVEDVQHADWERRWLRLGLSWQARILVVVYTFRRLKDGTETIRIISARQASRRERKLYAGQSD